jgi:hypothetical protein
MTWKIIGIKLYKDVVPADPPESPVASDTPDVDVSDISDIIIPSFDCDIENTC